MFAAEAALIGLREGLEALLVTGILLGLVSRLGRPDARRWVWLGFGAAAALSLALGLAVQAFFLDGFEAGGGEAFELVAALVAVGMLTYMVVWMWRHTRTMMADVRRRVQAALTAGSLATIALLTFASVLREGLEVVLFYAALATRVAPADLAWSGAVGFAASAVIVALILRGAARIDLAKFFGLTGLLLVFIAGGLLVHSVHAATELGLLPAQPALWDTGAWLSNDSAGGRIAHALVGYEAAPTLLQAVAYAGYVLGVGGWYLWSLGAFRARAGAAASRPRVAAGALVVLLVTAAIGLGAAGAFRGAEPVALSGLPEDAEVGVLYRSHGEPPEYNATTYASFARFGRDILTMYGFEHLLLLDRGTVLLDRAAPTAATPALQPELMDAWTQPHAGPAVFSPDAGALSGQPALALLGPHYLAPGGPGLGEPDILELWGLGAWVEWQKMDGRSPHYDGEREVKERAVALLRERYGDALEVRFGYMVNPHMHPRGELEEAAADLAGAGVTHVVDFYAGSIHSDVMNTCMMAPHVAHALEQAGFRGAVVAAGMAGHQAAWAEGVAAHVQAQLARFPAGSDVAVFLSQHGHAPGSENPCGNGEDQYARNAAREFELARGAIEAAVAWAGRIEVFQVYAQGGGERSDPDGRVLSPREALERAREAGFTQVLDVPYEYMGDGFDNLIVLREAYGFEPAQAPYHDDRFETHVTLGGIHVTIVSARFGAEAKARAHAAVIAQAIEEALGSDPARREQAGSMHAPAGGDNFDQSNVNAVSRKREM